MPCFVNVVDPVQLLPSLSGQWSPLRTMVLAINVPKVELETLRSSGDGTQLTVQFRREHIVTQGLPELLYTKAFATYLQKVILGEENFTVFSNQKLLSNPFCIAATSHPDLVFFHNQKYVVEGLLSGCAEVVQAEEGCTTQEEKETTYTLTGAVGEDKNEQQPAENQLVEQMVLLATTLGLRAVQEAKYFKKAVIFGQVRTVSKDTVEVYKLKMDFERGESTLLKGNRPVETSRFIQSVKQLLEQPQQIVL